MASRHPRSTSIGEYLPFHVSVVAASATRLPTTPIASGPALDLGHGVFLGTICINDPGVTTVLTIFNGNGVNPIAVIKPTTNVTLDMECVLDNGLWYTYTAGTPGSITLNVLPVTI